MVSLNSSLVKKVKNGLPNRSFLTTESSFSAHILALTLFNLFKKVCNWVVKFAQWKKKLAQVTKANYVSAIIDPTGYLC